MTDTINEEATEFAFPTLNTELLRDIVIWAVQDHDDAENRPFAHWGSWMQRFWAKGEVTEEDEICQTAFCIAGQAVAQTGHLLLINPWGTADACAPAVYAGVTPEGRPRFVPNRTEERPVPDVAREVLGLTYHEGEALFNAYNTIGHVIDYVLLFAEKRGVDLGLSEEISARRERHPEIEDHLNTAIEYPELAMPRHRCGWDDCPHQGQMLSTTDLPF